MVDILPITYRQKAYPHKDNGEFRELYEYISLAKWVIRYFGARYGSGFVQKLLSSEDAISNIATDLMMADWRWSPDHKSKDGKARTRKSYLNISGYWSLQELMSRTLKNQDRRMQSLDYQYSSGDDGESYELIDLIVDKKGKTPEMVYDDKEYRETIQKDIANVLNCGLISAQQQKYLVAYFIEEKSLAEIGKEYGVTREAIRQSIDRSFNKLQTHFNGVACQ